MEERERDCKSETERAGVGREWGRERKTERVIEGARGGAGPTVRAV